ncbi:MAG: hypothetical protein ACRC1H_11120 [Caldilineaceae bacterium]
MKASEFLAEFDADHFPQYNVAWHTLDSHDPPFTAGQLHRMEGMGLIEFNGARDHYRLTMKATRARQLMDSNALAVKER